MRRTPHCGCVEGTIGLLIGLGLFVHGYLGTAAPFGVRTVLTGLAFTLGGAVSGKVAGLAWPRLKAGGTRA